MRMRSTSWFSLALLLAGCGGTSTSRPDDPPEGEVAPIKISYFRAYAEPRTQRLEPSYRAVMSHGWKDRLGESPRDVLVKAAPKKLYTGSVWRFFGDISYGIYLWHMVLVQVVYRYAGVQTMTPVQVISTYVACVIPASIALGWLSFRFVERPLNVLAKKLHQERDAGLTIAASTASDARVTVNA